MTQQDQPHWPFATKLLGEDTTTEAFPASYQFYNGKTRFIANPADDVPQFVKSELSLGRLDAMLSYLKWAGGKHLATPLHLQIAKRREIIVADQMDLHLVWDTTNGRLFLKPMPKFLLDPKFWQRNLKCDDECSCQNSAPENRASQNASADSCKENLRKVAWGFLYTYVYLISSEIDFRIANEKWLLPRKAGDQTIEWASWKDLARELIRANRTDHVHLRFLRAELRLSRLNKIHYFTQLPPLDPYIRGWNDYSSFFRDNIAWIGAATVFVALVLSAMQLGIATERLQNNVTFQKVSYGFTIFSLLGPICALGLVVLWALTMLVKDLPWFLTDRMTKSSSTETRV